MTDDANPGGQFDEDATAAGDQQAATAAPTGASAIFGPFFNAIVAPREAFAAIDANPSLSKWVVVLVAALTTAMVFYHLPMMQEIIADMTIAQLRADGIDDSAEEVRQMMRAVVSVWAYGSFVFVVLGVALSALEIWVLAAVMGGRRATFGRAFGVASIATVIHPMLYGLYASVILTLNPPEIEIRRPEDFADIGPTLGLDFLLAGPETALWLQVLYESINLFSLWWAILMVMGCTMVLKLKQSSAIAVTFIIWALGNGISFLYLAWAQGLSGG